MTRRRDDAPRDLTGAASGLAPQAPPGPPQSVEHVRADVLALLSDEAKALVIGPAQDLISAAQQAGESDHTLMRMRGLLRRVMRDLYRYEVRRSGASRASGATDARIDFDPTTGFGGGD